jgi:hypothetical protein
MIKKGIKASFPSQAVSDEEKMSGEDRRVKKPRKRKYEKRKAGVKSTRRKK